MPLAPGTKLGPYQIDAPLGSGGMGEVYRARDTRLGRDVAVKILPRELSQDTVRKQRFEREAKTISGLNHPNICVLYDVGSQDGMDYLVMECVEGETLAKRLERGALPVEQVLKYGTQLADALDKAHRSGVVHRDLKPGNIVLAATGAKLLDFGLAKAVNPLASAATLTMEAAPVTAEGTIVGTFQYMSPEQIEGKEVDGRSDIFSLGAVLYEMVTGKRAFEGKSQLSVASAILEKEPVPISTLKPLAPPALDHTIRRCLAKDPDERWQMARDLVLELQWISTEGAQAVAAPKPAAKWKREPLPWVLAALFFATSAAGLVWYLRSSRAEPLVVADLAPGKGIQFTFVVNGPPAVSPDGRNVVYAARDASGKSMLWIRSLGGSAARPLPGTEDAGAPFWSPDSRTVGFSAHRKLQVIDALGGGSPRVLSETPGGGGTWNRSGTILLANDSGIAQVSAAGGTAVQVIRRDPTKYAFYFPPRFLPDGQHFVYQLATQGSVGDTYFASLDGKVNRIVVQGGGHAVYASGFLLYCQGTTLVAVPFDGEKGEVTGTARTVAEGVGGGVFLSHFDASQNGMLVYEPTTSVSSDTQLEWLGRDGKKLAIIGPPAIHFDLRLSPDARRLATSAGNPKSEIWVDDLERGVRMRLTFDPDTDKGIPVWSADGSRILYSTLRGSKAGVGVFEKSSNGTGKEEELLPSENNNSEVWATDWSRDGRFVLFGRGDMSNNSDAEIWVLPLSGARKPSLFLRTAGAAYDAQFSPDGRWVAYTSRESGMPEVYVVPFEGTKFVNGAADNTPGGKWQISSGGGSVPRWRGDGKELFYLGSGNTMTVVQVDGKGAGLQVGRSESLFLAPLSPFAITYDVSPDGKRFVIAVPSQEETMPLTVIFNWTTKLQAK